MTEPKWDQLSNSVRSLLDDIECEGSFFAKGVSDVNPGLEISGLGGIGIPISPHDATRLIQESRMSPFGKGTETFVDKNVRSTFELDAAQIQCCHPKYPAFLQACLTDVCSQLGVPGSAEHVRADLYKLLIYEEGAMFKPHKDTEKAHGMFGTLVIALPSRHEGGDVSVSFNGKHEILKTSTDSSFSTSYLAWYGDVLHEVKPVTKGYRIVLTYNLIHTGPSAVPTITEGDPRLMALQTALKEWSNDDDSNYEDSLPGYLIYMLEHQYTDDSLHLQSLKSADHRRVKGLLSIAEASGCEVFLASITKREYGGIDGLGPEDYARGERHRIIDVEEEDIQLRTIVATDGTLIVEDVSVEEEGVIMRKDEEEDLFKGKVAFDEDFEGWTGNEGAHTTLWYRKSAVIIMPSTGAGSFNYFMTAVAENDESSYEDNYCNLLGYYGMLAQSKDRKVNGELDYLIGLVGQGPQTTEGQTLLKSWPAPEHCYVGRERAVAAQACLQAGWLDRFTEVLVRKPDYQLQHGMQPGDYGFLCYAEGYDFRQLEPGLSGALRQAKRSLDNLEGLDGLIIALSTIAYNLREKQWLPGQEDQFEPWIKKETTAILSQPGTLTRESASPLLELLLSSNDATWIEQSIVPALCSKVVDQKDLAFSLIAGLSDALSDAMDEGETVVQTSAIRLLEGLCPPAISLVSLSKVPPAPRRRRSLASRRRDWRRGFYDPEPSPTPEEDNVLGALETIHRALLQVDSLDETLLLLQRVEQESEHVATMYFDSLVIPYLDDLVGLLQEHNIALPGSAYEQSIYGILRQYQSRVAGPRPLQPTDWSRPLPKSLCSCPTCKQLREFISDPNLQRTDFSVLFKVRQHAEKVLGEDFDCITHKENTPHTLEVIKTDRQFARSLQQWQIKVRTVEAKTKSFLDRSSMASLPSQKEDQAVGADADANSAGDEHSPGTPLQIISNPPVGEQRDDPTSGNKRAREEENEENLRPKKQTREAA